MKSIFKILIIIVLLLIIKFSKEGFQNNIAFDMNKLVIKGSDGDIGDQGVRGIIGDRGVKGPLGNQGSRGSQGRRGYRGSKGSRGIPEIPRKLIILWYSKAKIPIGWVECNGSNGTPDLRNKFVIGGWWRSSLGRRGGSFTHRLNSSHLPRHTHSILHNHHRHTGYTNTLGNHNHYWSASRQRAGTDDHNNTRELSKGDRSHSDRINKTTTTSGNHRHSFLTNYTGNHNHTVNYQGNSRPTVIVPPYYRLIYIMKV